MSTDNLKLWNAVEKTDPDHTKPVAFGSRKFTAIDAHYQVKCATEQFGEMGVGWGIEPEWCIEDGFVLCHVRLWHGDRNNIIHAMGQKKLGNDEDAYKKAMTDGMTKALSYLGFNADVFLGRFDDQKYTDNLKAEHEQLKADLEDDFLKLDKEIQILQVQAIQEVIGQEVEPKEALGDLSDKEMLQLYRELENIENLDNRLTVAAADAVKNGATKAQLKKQLGKSMADMDASEKRKALSALANENT